MDDYPNTERAIARLDHILGIAAPLEAEAQVTALIRDRPPQGDAQVIAATTAAAVREALKAAAGYTDRATLNAELDFSHRDVAGSVTTAKISIRFGR